MGRFVEGVDRAQRVLLPPSLEDYVDDDNPVRVVDVYFDELDLAELGFARVMPKAKGPTCLSSLDTSQDLSLWLPEPHPVEPEAGA